jgi:hypothetical protein
MGLWDKRLAKSIGRKAPYDKTENPIPWSPLSESLVKQQPGATVGIT